jgi:hypothetical protein
MVSGFHTLMVIKQPDYQRKTQFQLLHQRLLSKVVRIILGMKAANRTELSLPAKLDGLGKACHSSAEKILENRSRVLATARE